MLEGTTSELVLFAICFGLAAISSIVLMVADLEKGMQLLVCTLFLGVFGALLFSM